MPESEPADFARPAAFPSAAPEAGPLPLPGCSSPGAFSGAAAMSAASFSRMRDFGEQAVTCRKVKNKNYAGSRDGWEDFPLDSPFIIDQGTLRSGVLQSRSNPTRMFEALASNS